MKRLIIILSVFALMAGFCIWEIVYSSGFYSEQITLLKNVETEFDKDPENIDSPPAQAALDKAYGNWKENKNILMMISNHNTVRLVDEKIVALKQLVEMNQQYDAYVSLKTAISFLEELKNDIFPLPSNLL